MSTYVKNPPPATAEAKPLRDSHGGVTKK